MNNNQELKACPECQQNKDSGMNFCAFCGRQIWDEGLNPEPKQEKTKIYNVLWADRHTDTTATPFINLDDAINYAKAKASELSSKYPEDYKESQFDGWLFYVEYSCEGDCLWITESEI